MIDEIKNHLPGIADLCRKYSVRRLDLFGSAVQGDFDPASSDLDFLVLYQAGSSIDPSDRYLGLLEELETLLQRKVDLVDIRAARNPYFIANALKHRVMLYAA